MTPRERFGKRSNRRYKVVRKIADAIKAPEGHVIITGRTEGFKRHVYIEVLNLDYRGGQRVYFDERASKKEIRREVSYMIKEMLPV